MCENLRRHLQGCEGLTLVQASIDTQEGSRQIRPAVGLTRGGPRKKYITFYKRTETLFRMSHYFGTHMPAPSEKE